MVTVSTYSAGALALHSLADHAVTYALNLGLLYREGFGDPALLDRIVASIDSFTPARPAGDVVMRYEGRAMSVLGGELRLATFESPPPELPRASRQLVSSAYFTGCSTTNALASSTGGARAALAIR